MAEIAWHSARREQKRGEGSLPMREREEREHMAFAAHAWRTTSAGGGKTARCPHSPLINAMTSIIGLLVAFVPLTSSLLYVIKRYDCISRTTAPTLCPSTLHLHYPSTCRIALLAGVCHRWTTLLPIHYLLCVVDTTLCHRAGYDIFAPPIGAAPRLASGTAAARRHPRAGSRQPFSSLACLTTLTRLPLSPASRWCR